jgi:hypothetical protein
MEVYLIEKQLYYESYRDLMDFIVDDGELSLNVFLILMDAFGLDEE